MLILKSFVICYSTKLKYLCLFGFALVIKDSRVKLVGVNKYLAHWLISPRVSWSLCSVEGRVSRGFSRRSRTPPRLERWSRSCSHMRTVQRRPLVPHNKATQCEAVRLQKEHSVPEAGWSGALGSWVPSVGDGGKKPGSFGSHPLQFSRWHLNFKRNVISIIVKAAKLMWQKEAMICQGV